MVSIAAFQAVEPGSIPGQRIFFSIFLFFVTLRFFLFPLVLVVSRA